MHKSTNNMFDAKICESALGELRFGLSLLQILFMVTNRAHT